MSHQIFRIISFEIVAPYTLKIHFDDDVSRVINFRPILVGEMYGPLSDIALFEKVAIDTESHTLVWPNGADFDPETLYNWPKYESELIRRVKDWEYSI